MPPTSLRVPYTQQFSPGQTPLARLLPILRQSAKKGKLRPALSGAFFHGKANPDKLAGNTLAALRAYGIIDDSDELTDFGKDLISYQGKDPIEVSRVIAKHILLNLDGIAIVETIREMSQAGLGISLTTLPPELRKRGFTVNESSSDLSGVLGWLREAKILNDYTVDQQEYQRLTGLSVATLDVAKTLNAEQLAFLRGMLALNISEWTSYDTVADHVEALYAGEIKYNRKDVVRRVIVPLKAAGLLDYQKRAKEDTSTPEGRGGKAGEVKPTDLFEKRIALPILEGLYRAAGFNDLRTIRSKSLKDIVADIKQKEDVNKSGEALEVLAVRLCQLLELDFMGWRETDTELAGGGEVDAMLHSARLIYSRWQVQCKIGPITLEAVAKEVGLANVSLANVILLLSTGRATESAFKFRERIIRTSNLNIIFVEGPDLQKIVVNSPILLEILRKQAQDALNLKPSGSALRDIPPSRSGSVQVGTDDEKKNDDARPAKRVTEVVPAYSTSLGSAYCGDSLDLLPFMINRGIRVKLIMTSPPFALLRKKAYGNEDADSYISWFEQFIPYFKQILDPQGSIVIDIGGTWIKGLPVRSTYHLKLLLKLCESGFYLAQDFYHYNPAKLPTPAEWVTIRRLRVKDAINNVWWLTLDPFVPVDNRRILAPYSESMKGLLKNGYKPAMRPSGHDISDTFQRDNGGAIPPNLLQFSNTESNTHYIQRCKEQSIKMHPARFPQALPEFFIKFLTQPGDLVLDPFAGSNVTGAAAEKLNRRWLSMELDNQYLSGSKFRFDAAALASVREDTKRVKRKKRTQLLAEEPSLFTDDVAVS